MKDIEQLIKEVKERLIREGVVPPTSLLELMELIQYDEDTNEV